MTNPDEARFCSGCGGSLSAGTPEPEVNADPNYAPAGYERYEYVDPRGPAPNRLVPAILVTLFCCMPFGVVSIVYAAMSMSKNSVQDYEGAHVDAGRAVMWAWIAFAVGIVPTILWVVAMGAGVMTYP
ncbi:MAG: CD225/dispanin family protein [Planctomycetes bacterium]|nr:CD225/dispanin family protein [Planctomycetota bacterium]